MINSRLIVLIPFLLAFYASYVYLYNSTRTYVRSDTDIGDERAYSPLMATQHFHHFPSIFYWEGRPGYRKRAARSQRTHMIRARTCAVQDDMLKGDLSTIDARQNMPRNIVPPLPTTGCEGMIGFNKTFCEFNFQKFLEISSCVGAGLVVIPTLFLITWTVARWIRVVRPRTKKTQEKNTMIARIGEVVRWNPVAWLAARWWGKHAGHREKLCLGEEMEYYRKKAFGFRAMKVRNRLEDKEVWYGGARISMPWGRGRNWDTAIPQFPSKGTTQGMLIGLRPNSSSIDIPETELFDKGSSTVETSTPDVSETMRDDGVRVVSSGREAPPSIGAVSQRKPNGINWASELEHRESR